MLTRKQIDFYHEFGYLGVEGVLSDAEVEELRRVTAEFVQLSASVTEHTAVFDLEPGHTPESPNCGGSRIPSVITRYTTSSSITPASSPSPHS